MSATYEIPRDRGSTNAADDCRALSYITGHRTSGHDRSSVIGTADGSEARERHRARVTLEDALGPARFDAERRRGASMSYPELSDHLLDTLEDDNELRA